MQTGTNVCYLRLRIVGRRENAYGNNDPQSRDPTSFLQYDDSNSISICEIRLAIGS